MGEMFIGQKVKGQISKSLRDIFKNREFLSKSCPIGFLTLLGSYTSFLNFFQEYFLRDFVLFNRTCFGHKLKNIKITSSLGISGRRIYPFNKVY